MRGVLLIGLTVALAGCGQAGDEASDDTGLDDAETADAIAASEAPPPIAVTPQVMDFADYEANDIYGAGCVFLSAFQQAEATGKAPGDPVIAVALADAGYLKLNDTVMRLSPDSGSAANPLGARVKYDGLEYSFRLEAAGGAPSNSDTADFPAQLTIRDPLDRVVYQSDGTARCGA